MFFSTGDATEYSRHLFRVLDTDKDDHLSWKEVMVGFHNLSAAGDKTEKLRLVYKVNIVLTRTLH
jgi:hypothetical protein